MLEITYPTRVIFVPRAYMTLAQTTPNERRELNAIVFYRDLRSLEDDEEGAVYPECIDFIDAISVSGADLAQVVRVINGYTVTFEDGLYSVDITAANTNIAEKVNRNSVSVNSSNSVGLTFSKQIEDQSFLDGRVFIDAVTGKGVETSVFPAGTFDRPVLNFPWAKNVVAERGLGERILLLGPITVASGEDVSRYDIKGRFFANSSIDLQPGCLANGIAVEGCTISDGYHGTTSQYFRCLITNPTNIEGFIDSCKVNGVLSISGDTDIDSSKGTIVINPVSPGLTISISAFSGQITIVNLLDGMSVNIGVRSALVIVDASCIGGEITIVDHDFLIDNSGSGCDVTVINQHLVTQAGLQQIGGLVQSSLALLQQIDAQTQQNESLVNQIAELQAEVHTRLGLNPTDPFTHDAASNLFSSQSGLIEIDVSGDGENTTTETRRP